MPIPQPDPTVIEYLAALDLAAVYIATGPGLMSRVGAIKPIAMNTKYRWLHEMGFVVEWMAWCDALPYAEWLIGACGKYYANVHEPIMIAVELGAATETISNVAHAAGLKLVAHEVVVNRAQDMVTRAASMMTTLQKGGYLRDFNDSYRTWRIESSTKGVRVPDYPVVQTRLRNCLIRSLAYGHQINQAIESVRAECPWLVAREA